jgi:hypothetical protein
MDQLVSQAVKVAKDWPEPRLREPRTERLRNCNKVSKSKTRGSDRGGVGHGSLEVLRKSFLSQEVAFGNEVLKAHVSGHVLESMKRDLQSLCSRQRQNFLPHRLTVRSTPSSVEKVS